MISEQQHELTEEQAKSIEDASSRPPAKVKTRVLTSRNRVTTEALQEIECSGCGTIISGPRTEWKYCDACVRESQQ
jgi:hypothetical protein